MDSLQQFSAVVALLLLLLLLLLELTPLLLVVMVLLKTAGMTRTTTTTMTMTMTKKIIHFARVVVRRKMESFRKVWPVWTRRLRQRTLDRLDCVSLADA